MGFFSGPKGEIGIMGMTGPPGSPGSTGNPGEPGQRGIKTYLRQLFLFGLNNIPLSYSDRGIS